MLEPHQLIKFLTVFAGSTITVPSQEDLRDVVHDTVMYDAILKSPSHATKIRDLASTTGKSEEEIRDLVTEFRGAIKKYG